MTLLYLTGAVLLVLLIVIMGLRFVSNYDEFNNIFLSMVWVTMFLIIGAAVYLSYATPSFANVSVFRSSQTTTVDDSNLLPE
jgi:hypothetical protein